MNSKGKKVFGFLDNTACALETFDLHSEMFTHKKTSLQMLESELAFKASYRNNSCLNKVVTCGETYLRMLTNCKICKITKCKGAAKSIKGGISCQYLDN